MSTGSQRRWLVVWKKQAEQESVSADLANEFFDEVKDELRNHTSASSYARYLNVPPTESSASNNLASMGSIPGKNS